MDGGSLRLGTGSKGYLGQPEELPQSHAGVVAALSRAPADGVWATAPYLHNGSVPSLYWLLRPAAERPRQFCIGARDYDPRQVGYHVDASEIQRCEKGESEFRSTNPDGSAVPGNSVLGHSLEGKPGPDNPGIIGRKLTDEERYDVIEYLKTL
jgi:hypothetical protein